VTQGAGAVPRILPRILHCHSTFSAGGKEVRCARMMNAWGLALDHTIVSGQPEAMGARGLIDPALRVAYPEDFPALTGRPTPGRLGRIAKALKDYDLICTYNWGAMDVVMAHRVFAGQFGLPPLVHHEDGFNEDEAHALKPARNLYRRAALMGAARLVVPSAELEAIAIGTWHQPRSKVARIANGIDTAAFAQPSDPAALPVAKPAGQHWVGTLAGLRAVKQLPLLVEAMRALPDHWHCVIVGEGPERAHIIAAAAAHGIAHRVHLPGAVADPASVVGLFDIFALSSASEQFPLSVVEAMAAALPIAAPAVGDIAAMVAEPNRPYITAPAPDSAGAAALGEALAILAADPAVRARIGAANQAKARAEFDFATMLARYRAVYEGAMGREF
jgi:glycosyltransferase involved in cell wall biosynthesis